MGNEPSKMKVGRLSSRIKSTALVSETSSSTQLSESSSTASSVSDPPATALRVHLNDTDTQLILKRSSSGHFQMHLLGEGPSEDLVMTEQEQKDLKLLEEIGLGLEFSPGDPFIGQLVLEVVEAYNLKHQASSVYATVADEFDKSEPKFASTNEDRRCLWSDAKFIFFVIFSNSVLTISLKGRNMGGKQILGRAYLPVSWLTQGHQEMELELEGSKPGKVYGRVKVKGSYQWLRGTEDDGTYTRVNRLVLHKAGRINRKTGAAMAALEQMSQVNHSLLSHDNIWPVISDEQDPSNVVGGGSTVAGRSSPVVAGLPSAPPGATHHAHTPSTESSASDIERLSGSTKALAESGPRMPSASRAAHLQSDLAFLNDEGPTSTSAHAASLVQEFLMEQGGESEEIAGLKRALALLLVPVLERLDGLERRTQVLTSVLQRRLNVVDEEESEHAPPSTTTTTTVATKEEDGQQTKTTTTTTVTDFARVSTSNPVEPFISGQFEYGVGRPAKKRTVFMFLRKGHWAKHKVYPPGFLGTQRTDSRGRLGPLPVPPTVAAAPGHWEFVSLLPDDYSYAKGSLFMLTPGTKAVVFDLDGTITIGDSQVVTQFTLDALGASTALNSKLSHKYDLRPRRHALHVVRAWAAKGYQPIYLSGRQGSYYNLTLAWLIKHRYPPGPIHLTRSHLPTLPVYFSVGMFKVKYVEQLRAKGIDVHAAYGNTPTDIKAYEAAGIAKDRTFIIGPHAGKGGTRKIVNWTDHLPEILAFPDAPVPIPYTELLFTALPGYVKHKKVLGKDKQLHELSVVSTINQNSAAEQAALDASDRFAPSLVPGGRVDDESVMADDDDHDTLDGLLDDSDDESVLTFDSGVDASTRQEDA